MKWLALDNPEPLDLRIGYKAGWCMFYFVIHCVFCFYFSIVELGLGNPAALKRKQSPVWWFMDMFFVFITVLDLIMNCVVSRIEYIWDKEAFGIVWPNVLHIVIVIIAFSVGGTPGGAFYGRTSFTLILSIRLLLQSMRLPSVEAVIVSFVRAGSRFASTFFMLFVFLYVFGIFSWFMFIEACEDEKGNNSCDGHDYFGTLPDALLSQFQMITFDSWASGICRTLQKKYWWAFFYYIPFQCIVALLVLNVVTGVVVDAIRTIGYQHIEEVTQLIDAESRLHLKGAKVFPLDADVPATAEQMAAEQEKRDRALLDVEEETPIDPPKIGASPATATNKMNKSESSTNAEAEEGKMDELEAQIDEIEGLLSKILQINSSYYIHVDDEFSDWKN
eukprot:Platyproteum_vivax@DN4232_c0_g1_i1.p2